MSYFGFGYFLVPFLILAVPFIVGLRAVWLAVTRPKNYRGEPACERCGYGVRGLTTTRCPECGRDFADAGIITPAMELRRRGTLFGGIAGWSLLMVCLTLVWCLLLGSWFLSIFSSNLYYSMYSMEWNKEDFLAVFWMLIGPVCVWIAGIWLVVKRRKAMLRRADSMDAEAVAAVSMPGVHA